MHLPILRAAAPLPLVRVPTASIACAAPGSDGGLLYSPEIWTVGTTALLCTVFAAFEKGIELAEESVPKYVRPSIDAILREMATLGFLGLLVQTDILGLEKGYIAEMSERFLGEPDLCFELFEAVHQFLFVTAIAYFIASGLLVAGVVRRLEGLFDELDRDGDGLLTPDELRLAVVDGFYEQRGTSSARSLSEVFLASEQAFIDTTFPAEEAAEYRERGGMTADDVRAIAAERVEELVELDPLTIFLATATLGTPLFALDLTKESGVSSYVAGDYASVAPVAVFFALSIVSMSYGGFSSGSVELGQKLLGKDFVLSTIKSVSFAAAFFLLVGIYLAPGDAAALLAGSPSQAVVTESVVVAFAMSAMMVVLVRLDEVLFEFIGCAGRARLEAVGRCEPD